MKNEEKDSALYYFNCSGVPSRKITDCSENSKNRGESGFVCSHKSKGGHGGWSMALHVTVLCYNTKPHYRPQFHGAYVTFCSSHVWLCRFVTALAMFTLLIFSPQHIEKSLPFLEQRHMIISYLVQLKMISPLYRFEFNNFCVFVWHCSTTLICMHVSEANCKPSAIWCPI